MRIVLIFSISILLFISPLSAQETYSDTIPGTPVSFKMVHIPAGTYSIGSPASEENRDKDEGPQQEVNLDAFWMGVYEVQFDEYEVYRDSEIDKNVSKTNPDYDVDAVTRPSPPYEDPTFGMGKYGYPAGSMTQYAALMYCKWLSEKTGNFYRLPTEAEWEYACRAGNATAYHFGESSDSLDLYAWHAGNSDETFHQVGQKRPNAWGLYDMLGNVAEWTLDQYQEDFYKQIKKSPDNPWSKPFDLHPRTVKGGSFMENASEMRSAARMESDLDWKRRDPQIPKSFWWNTDSPFVGFRIVRPAKEMSQEEQDAFWARVLDEG